MRVAVIGAGVAGLSAAWNLVERSIEVVLFDPKGIGGGASGISTGLLHPFPGKKALRSWKAAEGMEATRELLQISEAALGRPVAGAKGIFRPAVTEQQRRDFFLRSKKDPDAEWKEISLPGAGATASGLWIPRGMTIYSKPYLQGLWAACQKRGAVFIQERFASADFDAIVLAAGFETPAFDGCQNLPLKMAIGQTLLCRWEHPLPFSLVSQGHITPTEDPRLCQVGSTYEHTPAPDPKIALELLEKASLFYPPARRFEIVEIRSGVRLARREGYRPIAAKISPKTWVFTGLGSRGMLYHALIGKTLAEAIVEKRDYLEPNDLHNSLIV